MSNGNTVRFMTSYIPFYIKALYLIIYAIANSLALAVHHSQ